MAIRDRTATVFNSASAASGALTWATNPVAGAKVLVAVCGGSGTPPTSVVDNGVTPTTFTLDVSNVGVAHGVWLYRADNITLPASGSYTVTVTWASAVSQTLMGQSYLGVAAGGPAATNNGSSTSTAVSTGSATPSVDGSLAFSAVEDNSALNPETITLTGAGFTTVSSQTNGAAGEAAACADGFVAWLTPQTCTWTLGDSVTWHAVIAVYSPVAVAPTNLSNTFEGGTNGTAISAANSGGASGNAFDTVTIGTNAALTYDNTHVMHGTLAAKVVTGSPSANCFMEWRASLMGKVGPTVPQSWFRIYCYLPALPASTLVVATARNTGAPCGKIAINASGKVLTISAAGATQTTSTTTVPVNQWFRLEGYVVGSPTVGQIQVQIFVSSPDGTTPDEVNTTTPNVNTANLIDQWIFGNPASTPSYTFWLDDPDASTVGYIGPSGPPVIEPPWSAARAGMPGDATAVDRSAQIGQFLAAHGITPVYQGAEIVGSQGAPGLALVSLDQFDVDQPFTMPAGDTTIGRVTIPITPVGAGADVMVGLYTNLAGAPGTLITQTRLPKSWLAQLGTPLATGASPPLATAQNNEMIAGPMSQTAWTAAAATLNGASQGSVNCSSGNYAIIAGGFDAVTSAIVANVASIAYLGGTSISNPQPQPSLPQASWGAQIAATPNAVVYAGGYGGAVEKTVYTASWDPSTGVLGAWTQQANLPSVWMQGGMAAWGDFVYLVSGTTVANTPADALSSVYYANAANGQITSWIAGPPLPRPVMSGMVAVVGNWLICAGGAQTSGAPITDVYYSAIRPDGSLVGWQVGPPLPEAFYQSYDGMGTVALGDALVFVGGTIVAGVTHDMPVLMFSADGPAPAWFRMLLPANTAAWPVGVFPGSAGAYEVVILASPSYYSFTMSPVPYISVPLPASGLTASATYHIVLHQIGGDLNDYVQVAVLDNALPATGQSATPGSGGPWTALPSAESVPLAVWDQTAGGKIFHLVEDGGAKITSLITAGRADSSQLLGVCEATQFADGSLLSVVSQIDYSAAEPTGVTQLA